MAAVIRFRGGRVLRLGSRLFAMLFRQRGKEKDVGDGLASILDSIATIR